jgi:hypothetical protein
MTRTKNRTGDGFLSVLRRRSAGATLTKGVLYQPSAANRILGQLKKNAQTCSRFRMHNATNGLRQTTFRKVFQWSVVLKSVAPLRFPSVRVARASLTDGSSLRLLNSAIWSWRRDSNPRPSDYKSDALPAELRQPIPAPLLTGPRSQSRQTTKVTQRHLTCKDTSRHVNWESNIVAALLRRDRPCYLTGRKSGLINTFNFPVLTLLHA